MEPTEHFGLYFGYIRRLFQRWVSPFNKTGAQHIPLLAFMYVLLKTITIRPWIDSESFTLTYNQQSVRVSADGSRGLTLAIGTRRQQLPPPVGQQLQQLSAAVGRHRVDGKHLQRAGTGLTDRRRERAAVGGRATGQTGRHSGNSGPR